MYPDSATMYSQTCMTQVVISRKQRMTLATKIIAVVTICTQKEKKRTKAAIAEMLYLVAKLNAVKVRAP